VQAGGALAAPGDLAPAEPEQAAPVEPVLAVGPGTQQGTAFQPHHRVDPCDAGLGRYRDNGIQCSATSAASRYTSAASTGGPSTGLEAALKIASDAVRRCSG
jgi:hypothetical protein